METSGKRKKRKKHLVEKRGEDEGVNEETTKTRMNVWNEWR